MKVVVFDLDDTLYKEVDYLRSAYRYIACQLAASEVEREAIYGTLYWAYCDGRDAFATLMERYNDKAMTKATLLHWYRYHKPQIPLADGCEEFLLRLAAKGCRLGIITDGRTITQMNKIEALALQKYISDEDIVISEKFGSEKPSPTNYLHFMNKYGADARYYYIADNTAKDFIAPNKLGWTTVCLKDNGQNVHKQNFSLSDDFLPKYTVEEFGDGLLELLNL